MAEIYGGVSAHVRNGRANAKDKHPLLVNLLILNTLHEREAASYGMQPKIASECGVTHVTCTTIFTTLYLQMIRLT